MAPCLSGSSFSAQIVLLSKIAPSKEASSSAGKRKFPDHPKSAQEILFFGKIGFLKPCPRCSRNPSYFLEKSDFSNRTQGAQEIRAQEILFFGKIGFLLKNLYGD
jgi:hypothetical protein